MVFTRRRLLASLATAVVGGCVAARVPTTWLPSSVTRRVATEYLHWHVQQWYNAHGLKHGHGGLVVGAALYEAYEQEAIINRRFFDGHAYTMWFKGRPIVAEGPGWDVRVLSVSEWTGRGLDH